MESWLGFWIWVLLLGSIGGVAIWWLGGWWYRIRLQWSGAVAPDGHLARQVFVYSSFVYAGPFVAHAVAQTLAFSSYSEAYSSDQLYSVALLAFPFWSLIASYVGVRTLFEVSRWKARLWFLILPGLVYTAALVAVSIQGISALE